MKRQLTDAQKMMAKIRRESLEDAFLKSLRMASLPAPHREYEFHPTRKWRFDFAWLRAGVDEQGCPYTAANGGLAVEVDGGSRTGGRHVRGSGYEEDARKLNEAALLGWQVLRFTSEMVRSLEAASVVKRALGKGTYDSQD